MEMTDLIPASPAAVGSLQCGHDFSAMEILNTWSIPRMKVSRFNVAMTFQPWKCINVFHDVWPKLMLQCGHDFSAMEMSYMAAAE